ncbi:MAG TPA: sigma-70 family RNA polymerase sigma factor [Gaiellaceae bacterium]|nr:sigma-70 family RNA polymerase sigma factor [Gaiellaceae bacterium]
MNGASADEVEALYRARHRAFVSYAAAVVGDGADAYDVVQEAFATALRKRRRFRGEGSLEGWLWSIVVSKARDRVRRRPRELPAASAEPAVTTNGHEADAAVRALLAALPSRQREAIFLRYFADLDYATIADLLGISPGTVAATLNAAHARLRSTLGAER